MISVMHFKISQVTQPVSFGCWKFDVLDKDDARLFSLYFHSKLAAENSAKLMDVVLQQIERIEI